MTFRKRIEKNTRRKSKTFNQKIINEKDKELLDNESKAEEKKEHIQSNDFVLYSSLGSQENKTKKEKSTRELKNLIKEWSKKLEKNPTMKQDLNLIREEDSISNNNNNLIDDIKLIEKGSIKDSESDEKSDSYKDNDDIIKSKITDENRLFDEKMVKKIIKDWSNIQKLKC